MPKCVSYSCNLATLATSTEVPTTTVAASAMTSTTA